MNTFLDEVLFKQLLDESRLLDLEDIRFAKQKAVVDSKSLPQILLELGLLSKQEITKIIALTKGVPFVDLTTKGLTLETLEHLPEPIARTHGMVCFSVDEHQLHVACMDLESIEHASSLHHDKKIIPHITHNDSMSFALKKYQQLLSDTFGDQLSSGLVRMRSPETFKGIEENLPARFHTELAEDISTNQVVTSLIKHARTSDASHIYFSPRNDVVEVSYRINGSLYEAMNIPEKALSGIIIKLRHMIDAPIMVSKQGAESGYAVLGEGPDAISLQILFFNTIQGIRPVIRILNSHELFDAVETLIVSRHQQELIYRNITTTPMILISGTKKSGKTRTYYSVLEYLGSKRKEVLSIEQPIEVSLSGISQLQASSKKNLKAVLKEVVHSRPDVVAFSPFELSAHVSMLGALRSGISLVAQVDSLDEFMSNLIQAKIATKELLGHINLVFVHKTFKPLGLHEKSVHTITPSEIAVLSKYISEQELIALVSQEFDQTVTSFKNMPVMTRKKVSKKDRIQDHMEPVYTRGVFSMNHVIQSHTGELTKVALSKQTRLSEKRAILENALLLSLRGEICFKDIIKYLNN